MKIRHETRNGKTVFKSMEEFTSNQINLIRDSYLADMIPQLIVVLRRIEKVHSEVKGPRGEIKVFNEIQKRQKDIMTEFQEEIDTQLLKMKQSRRQRL